MTWQILLSSPHTSVSLTTKDRTININDKIYPYNTNIQYIIKFVYHKFLLLVIYVFNVKSNRGINNWTLSHTTILFLPRPVDSIYRVRWGTKRPSPNTNEHGNMNSHFKLYPIVVIRYTQTELLNWKNTSVFIVH